MLSNAFPSPTCNCSGDSRPTDSILNGKLGDCSFSRGELPPSTLNYFFCQLRHSVRFSPRLSAVPNLIPHVVLSGSDYKMIGVDAGGVVAFMPNHKSVWNAPNTKFVSHSMSGPHSLTFSELSVSSLQSVRNPYPARSFHVAESRALLVNFRPESVGNRFWRSPNKFAHTPTIALTGGLV